MEPTILLSMTHYPRPVVRHGAIEWQIIGPVQASQPGLTCYDLMDAAALCNDLNKDYLTAYEEANNE